MIEITDEKVKECLNHIAGLDEGKVVLAYLKDWCGYGKDKIRQTRIEDTYANAAVERVYIHLRDFIRTEYLREIEFNYQRKAAKDGNSNAGKPSTRRRRITNRSDKQ